MLDPILGTRAARVKRAASGLAGVLLGLLAMATAPAHAQKPAPVQPAARKAQPAAATPQTVTVKTVASVEGREICMKDISDAVGPLGEIVVGAAALPGRSRTLTAGDIRLRLRASRVDPDTVTVPPVITISTVGGSVSGDAVVTAAIEAVRKVLPWPAEDTTIEAAVAPIVPVMRGGVPVLQAGAPVLRSSRTAVVPVTLTSPEGVTPVQTATVEVALRISVMVPAVVAARPISRRAIIGPDDVTLGRVEMSGGRSIGNVDDVIGKRAADSIMSGRAVTPADIEEAPVLAANAAVTVRVVSGAIEVAVPGTAREEGRVGQLIRVRVDTNPTRPGMGREIRARVADSETVVVENP